MGNFQCTSYRFPFVDVTFQVDALFDVVHSAMGDRIVPRIEEASAALHMLGSPRWSYNAQKRFCITLFLEILVCSFFDKIHHPGARFQLLTSAWQFEMTENRSRLTREWCIRAGIEPNAMIGQLVKTCPHACMGSKKKKKIVFLRESVVIWSWA